MFGKLKFRKSVNAVILLSSNIHTFSQLEFSEHWGKCSQQTCLKYCYDAILWDELAEIVLWWWCIYNKKCKMESTPPYSIGLHPYSFMMDSILHRPFPLLIRLEINALCANWNSAWLSRNTRNAKNVQYGNVQSSSAITIIPSCTSLSKIKLYKKCLSFRILLNRVDTLNL